MKNRLPFLFLLLMFSGILYAQTAPVAPSNLTATLGLASVRSVNLSWSYDSTAAPVLFAVYKKMGALADTAFRFMRIGTTNRRTFSDMAVVQGKTVSYYVSAIIGIQQSEPSNKVEITIPAPVISYGRISGAVSEDVTNVPIPRAAVQVIPVQSTGSSYYVYADSLGFFSVRVKAGQYLLYTSAHGYVSEYFDNVATAQLASRVTVAANDSLMYAIGLKKIVPPVLYSVTGSVKDAAGVPLRAAVNAYLINKRPGIATGGVVLSGRTDSLGNFTLKFLLNDTVVLNFVPVDRALKPEYYDNKATFAEANRIAVTGNLTGIDAVLEAKPVYANGITGVVRDTAFAPVAKAVIYAYRKSSSGVYGGRYMVKGDTMTGAYTFSNLEPGQYILLAAGRGYMSSYFKYDGSQTWNWRLADSVVVTANDVVTGVNFKLKKLRVPGGNSAVFGNVLSSGGSLLEFAPAFIFDASGTMVGSAITENDGSYLVEGIPAGSYSVVSSMLNYNDAQAANLSIADDNNLRQVDLVLTPNGITGVNDAVSVTSYELSQNYPNPFNPSTVIRFSLPHDGFVRLSVYNLIGQKITTLVNGALKAGTHQVTFDGRGLSSGIYLYKIESGSFVSVKKMTLTK